MEEMRKALDAYWKADSSADAEQAAMDLADAVETFLKSQKQPAE